MQKQIKIFVENLKLTASEVVILMLLTFCACQNKKAFTYEQGIENCNRIIEEKKKENPNGLNWVGPECLIGSQIPEFNGETISGKAVNQDFFIGKVSVINFWFIGCAPCVAEIPGFNKIVEKYGTEKVNYIAMGKDPKADILEFLEKHPWKFEQITDGKALFYEKFKLKWGFPTTYVLNKKGQIVLAFSGGKSDATAVEEIQNILIPVIEKELK